jgi:outer membrane lipoprotein LolB
MRQLAVSCITLLVLTGCASAPPQAVTRPLHAEHMAFTLDGRIAIKYDGEHSSVGVHWAHDADVDDVLLLAPLGVTVAHLRRDTHGAMLEASGKHYAAQDSDKLMQQILGWHLPLSGLPYWVMALPAPGSEASVERETNGQVSALRQNGWAIRYTAYATQDADSLPLRMVLQHDNLEIRLLIDEWQTK